MGLPSMGESSSTEDSVSTKCTNKDSRRTPILNVTDFLRRVSGEKEKKVMELVEFRKSCGFKNRKSYVPMLAYGSSGPFSFLKAQEPQSDEPNRSSPATRLQIAGFRSRLRRQDTPRAVEDPKAFCCVIS